MEITRGKLIHGVIADYCYEPSGLLVSYSKPVMRTVKNIADNISFVKAITKGNCVPLLIHLVKSPMPDKATRKFSAEKLPEVYTAMAMVSKPGLSQFIMKLLFKFQQPPIPMRSFSNESEARVWLSQFL